MQEPMKMGDPLPDKLWKLAKAEATSRGYEFTLPCEYHVKDFISQGVLKLRAQFDQEIPKHDEEMTETNLLRLVSEMIKYASTHGRIELQEESFFSVKGWICPLYPFC